MPAVKTSTGLLMAPGRTRLDVLHEHIRRQAEQAARHRAERRRTAIHEAGHAVVVHALGGQVAMATLDGLLCRALGSLQDAAGRSDLEVAGYVIHDLKGRRRDATLVAGMLAEQEFGYPDPWASSDADADVLRALALRKGISVERALERGIALAETVIAANRTAIAALADALLTRPLLRHEDVRQIVERNTTNA